MATRLEQHGDVVLEILTARRSSNIVRRPRQTARSAALRGIGILFLLAALWFWKVEGDHMAGQLLSLAGVALQVVAYRREDDVLWRKPEDAVARAAYQRCKIVEKVLGVGFVVGFLALLFLAPDGSAAWWMAFPALMAASYGLGRWARRAQERWLEPIPASEAALAIPPPFRY